MAARTYIPLARRAAARMAASRSKTVPRPRAAAAGVPRFIMPATKPKPAPIPTAPAAAIGSATAPVAKSMVPAFIPRSPTQPKPAPVPKRAEPSRRVVGAPLASNALASPRPSQRPQPSLIPVKGLTAREGPFLLMHMPVAAAANPWERQAQNFVSGLRPGAAEKSPLSRAPRRNVLSSPSDPGLGLSPPVAGSYSVQPLPSGIRSVIENSTGIELGGIRVVTGPAAEAAARRLGAKAFTCGGCIYLGADARVTDFQLLAHETAHVLQQTAGSSSELTALRLTSASRDLILRQPDALQERQQALDDLTTPVVEIGDFAMYRASLKWTLRFNLKWIGAEGLPGRLNREVHNLIDNTLGPWRDVVRPWMDFTGRYVKDFSGRKAFWEGLQKEASRTDDPGLVAAARELGKGLPARVGDQWTEFQKMIATISKIADKSLGEWKDGLASLYPLTDLRLRSMASDLEATLANPSLEDWVGEAILTVLDFPEGCADASMVANWVRRLRADANEQIQSLTVPLTNLRTDSIMGDQLRQITATQKPSALDLKTDLNAMAAIMEKPDGVILEREKLAVILARLRPKISSVSEALLSDEELPGLALGSTFIGLLQFSRVPFLSSFPNGFETMGNLASDAVTWAYDDEKLLFLLSVQSLGGIDLWAGLVEETVKEEETLDEEVPNFDSWWQRLISPLYVLARKQPKEKFFDKLLKKIPLFKELIDGAKDTWKKAQPLLERFKERIFKEKRILAPLWEFFIGMIGLELPETFVQDVSSRGGSLLGKILKHPFRFLGNLAKGIGLGLKHFGQNIGAHLLNSLLEWLLGEFDLQMPVTFGKIITALLKRIGFDWDNIYQLIADYLNKHGRKTDAAEVRTKIEKAIKAGTTALRWIKMLYDGDYAGFWQEVKNYLNELWQWVVGKVREYLFEKVQVEFFKLIKKLIDPTGISQILAALKGIYDAIQTILKYKEKLLEMVREVFKAIREIAEGNLDRAAGWVENGAIKITSVLVAFVAKYFGLDSIVKVFEKALDTIKKWVNKGINSLIKATHDVWEWLVEKAEEVVDWWKSRRKFTGAEGETRELYFDPPTGDTAKLYVSAPEDIGMKGTPPTLEEYLFNFKQGTDRQKAVVAEVARVSTKIDDLKEDHKVGKKVGDQIRVLFGDIVLYLKELGGNYVPPVTDVKWKTKNIEGEPHGWTMVADPLSIDPGTLVGSEPVAADTKYWGKIKGITRGNASAYIRGHLLNHHIHGPGIWTNMTPISRTTNTKMEKIAEGKIKEAVIGKNKVIRYEVRMVFGTHSPKAETALEKLMPSSIELEAEALENRGGKWVKKKKRENILDKAVVTLPNELRRKGE